MRGADQTRYVFIWHKAREMDARLKPQLAHALKGSSLTMGAITVAGLCAELEQANLQNSDRVAKLAHELEKAFASGGEIFKSERQKRLVPVAA